MVMVPSYKVFYENCGNVGETQETFRQDDRERGVSMMCGVTERVHR